MSLAVREAGTFCYMSLAVSKSEGGTCRYMGLAVREWAGLSIKLVY